MSLSFDKTAIAFRALTDRELKLSKLLFSAINYPILVRAGQVITPIIARIPLLRLVVKHTLFAQFVGGESLQKSLSTVDFLFNKFRIGSMLDYAVEGKSTNQHFDLATTSIINGIRMAATKEAIPFAVFKFSAIGSSLILSKKQKRQTLLLSEKQDYQHMIDRAFSIVAEGQKSGVPVFIDAEESWIQETINEITLVLMQQFNKKSTFVFTTLQCYLTGSEKTLKNWHKEATKHQFKLGIKLVRGAYLEKERMVAKENNAVSPVHTSKTNTDNSYDSALKFCIEHLETISLCSATHNEKSAYYLTQLIRENGLKKNDPRIFSAQLYGMSNHISFNLIEEQYNVVKYLPYGPLKEVIPYLLRRANENQSIQGQSSRELALINLELKRRKQKKEVNT